jgi:hypothetical protein
VFDKKNFSAGFSIYASTQLYLLYVIYAKACGSSCQIYITFWIVIDAVISQNGKLAVFYHLVGFTTI